MNEEPVDVLLFVTQTLEALEIPYLIGGSFASILYGLARTTNDADIVADLKSNHVTALVEAFRGEFYIEADSIRDAIQRQSSFNLIHQATLFKVDIFIPKGRNFDRSQFRRRLSKVMVEPDRVAWVASAEDIILAKLEWFRLGGEISERQWRDVLGVIRIQRGNLDEDYLRDEAPALQVSGLLERALVEGQV